MLFAPINPADLNVIEGKYPIRPPLPATPGIEGVGVVEKVGAAAGDVQPGAMVLIPHGVGAWREACVVDAARLIRVPEGIAPEQAAMLKINPATALRMLRDFVELEPGDWVAQNAANSGVGRAVIQLARARGLRTLNIVRRAELIDELRTAGGDAVLLDADSLRDEIPRATNDAPVRLALNSVGGESALRLAKALDFGGTIVTFGAMSLQPLRIPNGLLIFKDTRWRGFWITHWYEKATPAARDGMFAELFALAATGAIHSPVEKIYPIEEATAAITRAQQGGRAGKVLLGFSAR